MVELLLGLGIVEPSFIYRLGPTIGRVMLAGRKTPNQVETSNGFQLAHNGLQRSATRSGVSCAGRGDAQLRAVCRRKELDAGGEIVEQEPGDAGGQDPRAGAGGTAGSVLGAGAGELQEPGARQVRATGRCRTKAFPGPAAAVLCLKPSDEPRHAVLAGTDGWPTSTLGAVRTRDLRRPGSGGGGHVAVER